MWWVYFEFVMMFIYLQSLTFLLIGIKSPDYFTFYYAIIPIILIHQHFKISVLRLYMKIKLKIVNKKIKSLYKTTTIISVACTYFV